MKRILLGLVIVVVIATPVSVFAVKYLPWTKNIYTISRPERNDFGGYTTDGNTVTMFDYGEDRCYVTVERENQKPTAISCVKDSK